MKRAALRRTLKIQSFLEEKNHGDQKRKEGFRAVIGHRGPYRHHHRPQLETELKADLDGVTELRLDFGQVEYISSAGLRVLLSAQKLMNRQGKMVLTHVSESVMEIFEVTGFSDILTIE